MINKIVNEIFVGIMSNVKTFIIPIFLLLFFPAAVSSEVIVHDMIALQGEEIMLKAETRGKLLSKGGEVVEFFVNGKSLGKTLSGGDGFAFKQFVPSGAGTYKITARTGKEEDGGMLIALRKGGRILFVDVEGTLFEGVFSAKPKMGSKETVKKLSGRFPVVLLQTGMLNAKAVKSWLKENGFKELPVIPWKQGMIFDEIKEKGLRIKAIIGSRSVIESAREYKPKAYTFEEAEDAKEVKDWEEIGKKLK